MINFPLFAIRENFRIYTEDNLKLIDTYYRTYVLDDLNLDASSFLERRVLMLGTEYDYPIYSLRYKCSNLVQVNREFRQNKYKKFIDCNGKVLTYKPEKLVKVEWKYSKCIPSHDGLSFIAICENEPYHFIVREPHNYLAIITFMGGRHIYDTSMEKPNKEIMWRKI